MTSPAQLSTSDRWYEFLPNTPAWARAAAHVIALCTLPSAAWRLGIIADVPFGYDEGWIERSELQTAGGTAYLLLLCVISEVLALLGFGLVQRWGEVMPPWMPWLRGRRIASAVPTAVAGMGALTLTSVWTIGVPVAALNRTPFAPGMDAGAALTVQLVAYAPMMLWGPLLLALTVHYYRRRRSVPGRRLT